MPAPRHPKILHKVFERSVSYMAAPLKTQAALLPSCCSALFPSSFVEEIHYHGFFSCFFWGGFILLTLSSWLSLSFCKKIWVIFVPYHAAQFGQSFKTCPSTPSSLLLTPFAAFTHCSSALLLARANSWRTDPGCSDVHFLEHKHKWKCQVELESILNKIIHPQAVGLFFFQLFFLTLCHHSLK